MSLKSLIQRLLDSRTTPSEASHSSYPDDGTVTQFSPSATSVSSWTKVVDSTIAPSDGYVIVRGKATGESYVQITAGNNPPHMERSTFAKTALNQYPILNLPIAKGKTFKVYAENTAEITVGLIKSIGGGYNLLVWRALSCLRALSNFSQKVSSRANQIGLAAKFFRSQESLSTLPLKRTQRRAMGGLSSGDFLPTFWRLMSQAEDLCSYPVLCRNTKAKGLQFLFISRSLRDRKSTCWETKPQTFCNVGLALRNLLSTGGKLC